MPSDIIGTEVIEEDRSDRRATSASSRARSSPTSSSPTRSIARRRRRRRRCSRRCRSIRSRSAACATSCDRPLFVLATQNPIEQEGTYPLPEAQLDRFMFNVVIDYPSAAEEHRILADDDRQRRAGDRRRSRPAPSIEALRDAGARRPGRRQRDRLRAAAGAGDAATGAMRLRPISLRSG